MNVGISIWLALMDLGSLCHRNVSDAAMQAMIYLHQLPHERTWLAQKSCEGGSTASVCQAILQSYDGSISEFELEC